MTIKSSLNKRKSTVIMHKFYTNLYLQDACNKEKIYKLCHLLQLFPVATQFLLKGKFSDSSVLKCFIQLCFLCIFSPSIVLQISESGFFLLCRQQQHQTIDYDTLKKDKVLKITQPVQTQFWTEHICDYFINSIIALPYWQDLSSSKWSSKEWHLSFRFNVY